MPTRPTYRIKSTKEDVETAIDKGLFFILLPAFLLGVVLFFTIPIWLPFYLLFVVVRYIKDLLSRDNSN